MDDCITGVLVDISNNSIDKNIPDVSYLTIHSENSCENDDNAFFTTFTKKRSSSIANVTKHGVSPVCGKLIEIDSSADKMQTSGKISISSEDASLLDNEKFDFDLSSELSELEPTDNLNLAYKQAIAEVRPLSTNECVEMGKSLKETTATFPTSKVEDTINEVPNIIKHSQEFRNSDVLLDKQETKLTDQGSSTETSKIAFTQGQEDGTHKDESPLRRQGTFKVKKPMGSIALVKAEHGNGKNVIGSKSGIADKQVKMIPKRQLKNIPSKISTTWKKNSTNSSRNSNISTDHQPKNTSSGPKLASKKTSSNSSINNTSKTRSRLSTSSKENKSIAKYAHIPSKIKTRTYPSGANQSSTSSCKPNSSIDSFSSSCSTDVFVTQDSRDITGNYRVPVRKAFPPQRSQSTRKPAENVGIKLRSHSVRSVDSSVAKAGPMKAFTPVCNMVKSGRSLGSGSAAYNTPPISQAAKKYFGSIPSPGSFSQFKISDPLAVSTPNIESSSVPKQPRRSAIATPVASPAIPRPSRLRKFVSSDSPRSIPASPRTSKLRLPMSLNN